MRIISNFHDFYDCGMSYGQDDIVIYKRIKEEINDLKDLPSFLKEFPTDIYSRTSVFSLERVVILVAGKIYIGYRFPDKAVFYDGKEINKYILGKDKDMERQINRVYKKRSLIDRLTENLGTFNGTKISNEIFRKHNAPILTETTIATNRSYYNHFTREKNSCLKELCFYRIFQDPVQLYQEIYMYISGVLGIGEPYTAKVTEPEIIEKKGFDLKYGFRKRPKI